MAEILLKIDTGSNYEDGDILCAFNQRCIMCCHAQHLCHPDIQPRNRDGLILPNALGRDWFEITHQYRFERLNKKQVRRITIATGEQETFSDRPNAKGEFIQVEEFLAKRYEALKNGVPKKPIFGTLGREIWYGGRTDASQTNMNLIWDQIELKTSRRRTERVHRRWPLTPTERCHFLGLPINNFSDAERHDMCAPLQEQIGTDPDTGEPLFTTVKKRKTWVEWQALLPLEVGNPRTATDVRDMNKDIDCRDRAEGDLDRMTIRQIKSLP